MKRERRTKTLAGLDLNGLRDFCARDIAHVSGEYGKEQSRQFGWRSVAVRIDDIEKLGDVIAGPQAERSYYGRGAGFGAHVGDPRRRVEFHNIWRRIELGEWEEPGDAGEVDEDRIAPVMRAVGGEAAWRPLVGRQADPTLLRALDSRERREEERGDPALGTEETPAIETQPVRPPGLGQALRAGMLAAAPGAQRAALVVSDIPALDEPAQEWLRDELARTKLNGCTVDLLWRPVAVVLGALNENGAERARKVLEEAADRGSKSSWLAVLIAGVRGVEIQELLLRSWKGSLLPERKRHGTRHPWKGDWASRCQAVLGNIREENGREVGELIFRQTRLIERMASENVEEHKVNENAVRDNDGRWRRIEIGRSAPVPEEPLPEEIVRIAKGAGYVLLYSPAGGTMTRALELGLAREGISADKIVTLNSEAAARGALEAARRLDRGEAPYLDHLPQLDLWAEQPNGSLGWSTLIPADKAVEAGKIYKTPKPIKFSLLARTRTVYFKLRKGTEVGEKDEVLKDLPRKNHKVQVYAEQRPASGYATCTVTSESYEPFRRRPIRIRWSDLGNSEEDYKPHS